MESRSLPVSALLLVVGFFVGAVVSCGTSGSRGSSAPESKELKAVRAYLKENLDDPQFEVVRWWPAKKLQKEYDDNVKEMNAYLEKHKADKAKAEKAENRRDLAEAEMFIKSQQEHMKPRIAKGPPTLCRLKYRTKIGGGLVLRDQCFVIVKGKAEPVTDVNEHREWYRRVDEIFPN